MYEARRGRALTGRALCGAACLTYSIERLVPQARDTNIAYIYKASQPRGHSEYVIVAVFCRGYTKTSIEPFISV